MTGTTPSITSDLQEYFFAALVLKEDRISGILFMGYRVEPGAY